MSNPYNLTDEQMKAYAAQVEEEKRARDAMSGGEVKEFCEWLREWATREAEEANQIKFGNPWIRKGHERRNLDNQ